MDCSWKNQAVGNVEGATPSDLVFTLFRKTYARTRRGSCPLSRQYTKVYAEPPASGGWLAFLVWTLPASPAPSLDVAQAWQDTAYWATS